MAQLLLKENCTVTITHSKTKDLKAECLEADIIGAKASGFHVLHFNAHNEERHNICDIITELDEIKSYL